MLEANSSRRTSSEQPPKMTLPSSSHSELRSNKLVSSHCNTSNSNNNSNSSSRSSNMSSNIYSSISPSPLSAFAILVCCFCTLHGLFITCEARAAAMNVTSASPSSSSSTMQTTSSEHGVDPVASKDTIDSFNADWTLSKWRGREKRKKTSASLRGIRRKQRRTAGGGKADTLRDHDPREPRTDTSKTGRAKSNRRTKNGRGKTSAGSLRSETKQHHQEAAENWAGPRTSREEERGGKDNVMLRDSQEILYVSVPNDDSDRDLPASESLRSRDDGFWNNTGVVDSYEYDDFPGIWEMQRPAAKEGESVADEDKPDEKGERVSRRRNGGGDDGGGGSSSSSASSSSSSPRWQRLPTDEEISRFKKLVERTMACRNLPALTMALVKGGHVLLTANLGHADPEHRVPVTRNTRFAIGSLTKAFTSTIVSEVLQRLNVSLDRPIHKLMPENFQLMDEMRTHSVTIRDLLGHRTGVPGYFHALLMGFPAHVTRQQLLSRLQYVPAVVPLRSQFIYNNYLYTLAAHVVEHLTGRTWEALVRDLILDPLGMRATGFVDEVKDFSRFALPCAMLNGTLKNLSPDLLLSVSPCGPAGSLFSTAHDMARWLQVLLGNGKRPDGERVLQDSALRETTRAVMPPPGIGTDLTRPEFPIGDVERSYGMGWVTSNYRGYRKVWHSGGIVTYSSRLWLLPGAKAGLFVATNGPQTRAKGHALTAITSMAADLLLGETFWLNSSTVCSFPMPWRQPSESDLSADDSSSSASTTTTSTTTATATKINTPKSSGTAGVEASHEEKASSASASSTTISSGEFKRTGGGGEETLPPSSTRLRLSASLRELVGVYTHKAFGEMVIERGKGNYTSATAPFPVPVPAPGRGSAPSLFSRGSGASRRTETNSLNTNLSKGSRSDGSKSVRSSSNSGPSTTSDADDSAGRAAGGQGNSTTSSSSSTDWLMLRFGRFGQLKLKPDPANQPDGWEGRFVGPLWYVTASDESDRPLRVRFLQDESGRVDRIRFPIDQLYDVIEFRKRQQADVTASSSYSASCHGSTFEYVLMTVVACCLSGLSLVKRITVT